MSIDIGKVKIVEEINHTNNDQHLAFFKFKQNKVEYYAISFLFDSQKEGYLAFNLENKYSKLFEQSDYNNQIMLELIEQKVNNLYFISFADEDPESEIIEYVGEIEKGIAINIIKESGKGQPNED